MDTEIRLLKWFTDKTRPIWITVIFGVVKSKTISIIVSYLKKKNKEIHEKLFVAFFSQKVMSYHSNKEKNMA